LLLSASLSSLSLLLLLARADGAGSRAALPRWPHQLLNLLFCQLLDLLCTRKRCSLVLFSPYALLYIFSLPHSLPFILIQSVCALLCPYNITDL
jgi:hypothetical protein